MRFPLIPLILLAASLLAAQRTYAPFSSVKTVLDAHPEQLPAELRNADESQWTAWSQSQDKSIRARLEQGDLDSMVNLLLFGTSFTTQPRVKVEALTEASRSGALRARVDDLVEGLRRSKDNERLLFVRGLLRKQGIDVAAPDGVSRAGVFVYNNLLRVLQERRALADRAKQTPSLGRQSLFSDRGVSLDTSILPNFSIEQALRGLQQRGLLRQGQVARVAVIGPGLDFIDKNDESAFDYYPQQTLQPFALYDSLLRLKLAQANQLSVSILDISARVIEHLQGARQRAAKKLAYRIQLPHDVARPWPASLTSYWQTLGDQIGAPATPIRPPQIFAGLETRAVQIRPEVVLACQSMDLNIVLERLQLPEAQRFDLIVATNIFVYYGPFEQSLALENAGAMLKSGGILLTNDRLPVVPGGEMLEAGQTEVHYAEGGTLDTIDWYRKRSAAR